MSVSSTGLPPCATHPCSLPSSCLPQGAVCSLVFSEMMWGAWAAGCCLFLQNPGLGLGQAVVWQGQGRQESAGVTGLASGDEDGNWT